MSPGVPIGAAGDFSATLGWSSTHKVSAAAVERRIAKAIQAIAACIDCLMAHTGSIPHDVGDLMVMDGSSRGAAISGGIRQRVFGRDGHPQDAGKRRRSPRDWWLRGLRRPFSPAIMTRFLAQAPPEAA